MSKLPNKKVFEGLCVDDDLVEVIDYIFDYMREEETTYGSNPAGYKIEVKILPQDVDENGDYIDIPEIKTFSEWYEYASGDEWHEDYAHLYPFADEMSLMYEHYCTVKGFAPIYDKKC